ncbi:tetratricopeptide repeat protein [Thermodesulfobacteriota bacterium]
MKFYRLMLFSLLFCLAFPLMSNADQLEDAKAAIKSEDYIKAKRILNSLANENNAEAQNLLGALYVNGQGIDKDITKGLSWIMKAAKQGHKAAQMNAIKLCMDIGSQGDTSAMFNVGYMCLKGWGGEQDKDACLRWMETAGKMGHAKSVKTLIRIYTEGMFGVAPNEEKAAYWSNMTEAFAAGIDGKY